MMNKSELKNFAVNARLELLQRVTDRARIFGVDEECSRTKTIVPSERFQKLGGALLTDTERAQRDTLIARVYENGYRQTMEEAAYTWFNRFIALRYMQEHDRLPVPMHVFPDAPGAQPQLLREAQDVDLPGVEMDQIFAMLDKNQTDALYKTLLIALCNALSESLPGMFETISDTTELLFPDGLLKPDSVLGEMAAHTQGCWEDIQVVGWLYQYYNTQLKDETFELLKKNVKITKDRIGAATQLFTPEWIVNYMVENSLGRIWLEGHPSDSLRMKWRYYMDEAEQETSVAEKLAQIRKNYAALQPEQITLLDPCMGSGHILVYAFDVLMDIYRSVGYTDRDAAASIVQNNLYGLDIDDRAAQLAYFAVMMKACEYDRRFLRRGVQPHVCAIQEGKRIEDRRLDAFGAEKPLAKRLLNIFVDAKEYGSILNINFTQAEFSALKSRMEQMQLEAQSTLAGMADNAEAIAAIEPLLAQAEILARKYDAVITNPPYMGSSGMNEKLSKFVKDNYPDSKSDLFAVFMERGLKWVKDVGYTSMITMESWMFLSSFEKLRKRVIDETSITTMVHMPYLGKGGTSLGINFGTAATIINKVHTKGYVAAFDRISYYETDEEGVPYTFPVENEYYKYTNTENFTKIPGHPIAYWVSERFCSLFQLYPHLKEYSEIAVGLQTGDNDRFMRLWHEVNYNKITFNYNGEKTRIKWVPHNKGGEYRKWYGNIDRIVLWEDNGKDIRMCSGARPQNTQYYFRKGFAWSNLTSGSFGLRLHNQGCIFDTCVRTIYTREDVEAQIVALLNSTVCQYIMDVVSPTMHYNGGPMLEIPFISTSQNLDDTVCELIDKSKSDWDSFETSWDFKKHPLI